MRLPNAHADSVDPERLRRYVLNLRHPEGRNKARVFRSVFGLDIDSAKELQIALQAAAASADAVETRSDAYGRRFRIDFEFARKGRIGVIRSAWFLPAGSANARFLSCWVLLKSVRDA